MRSAQLCKTEMRIDGLTCAVCAAQVEEALKTHAGVREASVNLVNKHAEVEYDADVVTLEELEKLVRKAGFQPQRLS